MKSSARTTFERNLSGNDSVPRVIGKKFGTFTIPCCSIKGSTNFSISLSPRYSPSLHRQNYTYARNTVTCMRQFDRSSHAGLWVTAIGNMATLTHSATTRYHCGDIKQTRGNRRVMGKTSHRRFGKMASHKVIATEQIGVSDPIHLD